MRDERYDWEGLYKYLRTSYGVTGLELDTDSTLVPGYAVLDAKLVTGGTIHVAMSHDLLKRAEDDFSILWKEVDKVVATHVKEKATVERHHPDELLAERKQSDMLADLVEGVATNVPDLMEWVIGFREWRVPDPLPDGVITLGSCGYQGAKKAGVWKGPQEVKFWCPDGHKEPLTTHECGFYGYYDLDSAGGYGGVKGVIRARGVLCTHDNGFRSEYAQPIALGYDLINGFGTNRRSFVEAVAQRTGLPAMPLQALRGYAEKFGKVVPESLLPRATHNWTATLTCRCGAYIEMFVVDKVTETEERRAIDERNLLESRKCESCDAPLVSGSVEFTDSQD